MRKTLLSEQQSKPLDSQHSYLDLEKVASVEISSEDPAYPIEEALHFGAEGGWRAATPGPQRIHLHFDRPQRIQHIHLEFSEPREERSQEIALYSLSSAGGRKEIARQQWNFSPGGSSQESEDFVTDIPDVVSLELEIDPGRHDRTKFATLKYLAVA